MNCYTGKCTLLDVLYWRLVVMSVTVLTSVCDVIWVKGSLAALVEWMSVSLWNIVLFHWLVSACSELRLVTREGTHWSPETHPHERVWSGHTRLLPRWTGDITNWKNTFHPVSWPMSSNFFYVNIQNFRAWWNKASSLSFQLCPPSPPVPSTYR